MRYDSWPKATSAILRRCLYIPPATDKGCLVAIEAQSPVKAPVSNESSDESSVCDSWTISSVVHGLTTGAMLRRFPVRPLVNLCRAPLPYIRTLEIGAVARVAETSKLDFYRNWTGSCPRSNPADEGRTEGTTGRRERGLCKNITI